MPTAATMNTAGGTQQGTGQRRGQQVMPVVPFIRASSEHREPAGIDVTRTLSASGSQDLGVFDVPAYGYVRSLVIQVDITGGTGGTFTADGPFRILQNIALTEPNGAVICQFNDGYDLYLANKYGGYRFAGGSDPKNSPAFVSSGGNGSFILRIPVELNGRDGLGSLPNQNAAATFKLRASLATGAAGAGNLYSAITTQPNVRVRVYLEAWDQPETASAGMTNQVTPPAMNTTQFWSTQVFNVSAGQQNIRLTRVGNYIRNLLFVWRNAAGARTETGVPDPVTLYLDTRPMDQLTPLLWRNQIFERSGLRGTLDTAGAQDAGVFLYDYTHEFDGSLGQENRDLWLPTLGSTRLELQGVFGTAGTLSVLTNDVAIAGSVFV